MPKRSRSPKRSLKKRSRSPKRSLKKRSRSPKRSLKRSYNKKQLDFAKKIINKMTKDEVSLVLKAMNQCNTHKEKEKCIETYLKNNNKNLYNKLKKTNKQFMNL